MCVLGGFKKSEVKGEGVKSGYRTKGLITHEPGRLALQRSRHLSTRNKNQLCDYMTTEPARLAGIPGSRVEISKKLLLPGAIVCYMLGTGLSFLSLGPAILLLGCIKVVFIYPFISSQIS